MKQLANHPHAPRRLTSSIAMGLGVFAISLSAAAQPVDPGPTAGPTAAPAPEAPAEAKRATSGQPDLLAEALRRRPGGETAASIGRRARRHSPAVRVQEAEIRASAAKVDQAMIQFLPQLKLQARYTRISPLDAALGGGAIAGAANPGLLRVGPCPDGVGQCVVDSQGVPAGASAFNIAVPLDNYSLSATLAVPISDYILRLPSSRAAVKANLEASQANKRAQLRKAEADAQLAYYNWVSGVAQLAVAEHALTRLERLQKDGEAMLAQGVATRADVLRLKSMVASGKVAITQARAYLRIAEKNLALLTGDKEPSYTIGEDILAAPKELARSNDLEQLVREGLTKRPELRALAKTKHALKKSTSVVRAGKYPRLDGFADYTYAKPGRNTFSAPKWEGSWSIGAQLSWTLNDIPGAEASAVELEANLEQVIANESLLRQGIEHEITAAYFDREQARVARGAAEDGEEAAREALASKMEQFRVGEATATDVINAEQELVHATLQRMNAYIALHVARVRLAYATGR
ncbi:MAG: TolC family protein [Polyangiaceae bacterium]|nr:TolC family protein [Polyangiaceae bacterium]